MALQFSSNLGTIFCFMYGCVQTKKIVPSSFQVIIVISLKRKVRFILIICHKIFEIKLVLTCKKVKNDL
jgi:hypothetical protein